MFEWFTGRLWCRLCRHLQVKILHSVNVKKKGKRTLTVRVNVQIFSSSKLRAFPIVCKNCLYLSVFYNYTRSVNTWLQMSSLFGAIFSGVHNIPLVWYELYLTKTTKVYFKWLSRQTKNNNVTKRQNSERPFFQPVILDFLTFVWAKYKHD